MSDSGKDDALRLIEFLQQRDVPCPVCGYNLRDLSRITCPECGHGLQLMVGVQRVRFGWFLATVTPSLFSGLAAAALLSLMLAAQAGGAGPLPPMFHLLVLIGSVSGLGSIVLIFRRHWFIRLRPRIQRKCALAAWIIHGVPFLGLVLLTALTA